MRHALLEVDQFAGIVELVADDPAAAEPHLRRAYNGFRRMGLDADTAETAALLARACLALDRDAEADELCTESERLAGHALKASIAWRTVRAQLLARSGAHDEARRVAEEACRHRGAHRRLGRSRRCLPGTGDGVEHRRRRRGGASRRRAGGRPVRTERGCGTCGEGALHSRRARPVRLPRLHPKRRPSSSTTRACERSVRRTLPSIARAWDECRAVATRPMSPSRVAGRSSASRRSTFRRATGHELTRRLRERWAWHAQPSGYRRARRAPGPHSTGARH